MFANIDNPPMAAPLAASPRLAHAEHQRRMGRITGLLTLAGQAQAKADHCSQQCDSHSFLSSPFVSKLKWEVEARKWSYICYRLERYYFKKLCELNSLAYREMTE